MSRVKVSNTLSSRIISFLLVVAFIIAIAFLSYRIIMRDKKNNIFDLGNIDNRLEYKDTIVNSYDDYMALLAKYNVSFPVKEEDFNTNSYLFLFQDYNPCGENKPKSIAKVDVDKTINVTYRVYNKCGWCQKHMALYILKTAKVIDSTEIEYDYTYANTDLNCGTVSRS